MGIDLDAIKKHHENWEAEGNPVSEDNVTAHLDRWKLIAEVERLTAEQDEKTTVAMRVGEALGIEQGASSAIGKVLEQVLSSGELPEQLDSDVDVARLERDEARALVRRIEADEDMVESKLYREIGEAITRWDAEKAGAQSSEVGVTERERAWLLGYGTALAEMVRWQHDHSTTRKVMRLNGVTLTRLRCAGLAPVDLKQIRGHRR